jgi:hypothetical protein
MAFVLADRVKETTTTTGTGAVTLLGAATGYQSFAVVGNTGTTYYAIVDTTNNVWEIGLGTYSTTGPTLTRTTVYANSSGTTVALTLAAGTKDVFCTQPGWSTQNGNITLGYQSGNAIVTGANNVHIGNTAGLRNSNSGGTFVGSQAGATNNNGSNDVTAIGVAALGIGSFYTGQGLTAVGAYSLAKSYTTNTVAVGGYSLYNSFNAQYSVAVGHSALYSNNSGWYHTAIGAQAGYALDSGNYNTFVGYQAGYGGTTPSGANNVVVGAQAFKLYTAANNNTVVGYAAAPAVTSGTYNIVLGSGAAANLTTSGGNIIMGYSAGAGVSTSSNGNNVAIGYQAANGASGGYNINIGFRTMFTAATGEYNTNIGYTAGYGMTSGNYNVILGAYQGNGGIIDMTTTNNNVVVSDNSGNILLYKVTSGLGGFNVPMADRGNVSATGSTGTVNFDASTQQVLNVTTAATANFTLNIRGNSTTTLNAALPVGQVLALQYWNLNGATPYYMTAFQIDGVGITPKWITGTAPVAGNANAIDVYTFTIYKTGGGAYTVLAKLEKYA